MTATARAQRTVAAVRMHRALGVATRRRRLPQQIYPRTIEMEYARALLQLVDAARAAFGPLLSALPRLTAAAAAARRVDDEGGNDDEARRLIDTAKQALANAVRPVDLEALARRFADRTSTYQRDQLRRQTRAALGADVFAHDRALPAIVRHFTAENVALIRDLPEQIARQIEQAVTRAFASGTPHSQLAEQIDARFDVGESRARLIARDQIGKLYGQVNAARQQDLGVTSFVWRTVHDERVRPEHAALDGETFRYDDPPDEGLPGEAINCRCTAEPDFSTIRALDDDDNGATPPAPASLERERDFTPVAEDDANRFMARVSTEPLPPAERQALSNYQGGKYIAIQDYARTGNAGDYDSERAAKAEQRALDSAIRRGAAPRDVLVYRGIGAAREGITGEVKVGSVIRDRGYSSTSISRDVAHGFAEGKLDATVLEIEVPRGSPAAFVPGDGSLQEAELLLPRGSRFEVLAVRTENGVRVARVRLRR